MIKKIVIIEDEHTLTKVLKESLTEKGFDVFTASDGEKGLDVVLKEKPDLILLDILMPNKNGVEMLNDLRKDEWGENANVVVLTNLTDHKYVAEIMSKIPKNISSNPVEYWTKSNLNINEIVLKIEDRLKN